MALERHAEGSLPPDDRVDHKEYLDILGEACSRAAKLAAIANAWTMSSLQRAFLTQA